MAYIPQLPLKEELEHLHKQQMVIALGIDKTLGWYYSFVLVPKHSGKVWLCPNQARLNQALIRLVHSSLTVNNIFPKVSHAQYLTPIVASLGFHNIKLEKVIISNDICMPI